MRDKFLRQDIEVIRLVSALGIVWFHSNVDGSAIGYSALVVFLIISTYLLGEPRGSYTSAVGRRLRRLGIPFLAWSLVYGVHAAVRGNPPLDSSHGWVAALLASPSIHLWFLPFIFLCLVTFDAANRTRCRRMACLVAGIAAAAMLFLTPYWRSSTIDAPPPISQYVHALPAVLCGYFCSGFDERSRTVNLLVLFGMMLGAASAWDHPGVGFQYVVGIGMLLPVLLNRAPRQLGTWSILPASACSFGIYLVHPLVFSVVGRIVPPPSLLFPVVTFLVSLGAIYAFRRWAPRLAGLVT